MSKVQNFKYQNSFLGEIKIFSICSMMCDTEQWVCGIEQGGGYEQRSRGEREGF
jgi:hypothetical protein